MQWIGSNLSRLYSEIARDVCGVRVAHVVSELNPGGVTTMIADLLPALCERGIAAHLWHFGGQVNARRHVDCDCCPIVDFGPRQHGLKQRVSEILARIQASDVDIIHLHDLSADVVLASMLCGRRVVAHIHEAPPPQLHDTAIFTRLGLLRRVVRPRALRRFDAVVACSEAAREFARRAYGLSPDRLRVVRNGINIRRVQREMGPAEPPEFTMTAGAGATRLGYLGRLDSVKNLPLLLSTCIRMRNDGCNWSLTIVGDGPVRSALQRSVADAGLSDRVRFTGEVTDPISYLKEIDVLAHPSNSEGMSISVLEAMALGIPVAAVRVGGNAECIVHGETGLLSPPGDEDAFTEACRSLCDDEVLRARMGRNAQSRAGAEFQIDRVADEVIACYAEALSP